MKLWIPAALVSVCGIAAAVESLNMSSDPASAATSDLALADAQDSVHEQVQRELERAQREVEAAMRAAERAREQAVRQAERAHEQARSQAERDHEQAMRQAEQAMRQAEQARSQALRESERARERAERDFERALTHSQRQAERGAPHTDGHAAQDARRAYEAALGRYSPAPDGDGDDDRRAVTGLRRELDGLARSPRSESDAIRSLEERVSELERRLGITPSAAPSPMPAPRDVRAPRAPRAPRALHVPQPPARPAPPSRASRGRSEATAPSADCCSEGATHAFPSGVRVLDLSDLESELAQLPDSITIDLDQIHRQLAELEGLDLAGLASSRVLLDLEALEALDGLEELRFSGAAGDSHAGYSVWTSDACPSCNEAECSDCSDDDDCDECDEEDGCCAPAVVFGGGPSSDEDDSESREFGYAFEVEFDEADECDEYDGSDACEDSAGDVSGFELDLERFSEPWGDSLPEPEEVEEPSEPVSTHAPSLVSHWTSAQPGLLNSSPVPWTSAAAPRAGPTPSSPLLRELSEIVDEMRGEVADLRATLRSLRAEVQRAGSSDFNGQL